MTNSQLKKIAALVVCLILFRFSLPYLWVFYLFCIPPMLIFLILRYVIFPKHPTPQEPIFHERTENPWFNNLRNTLSSHSGPIISQSALVLRQTLVIAGILLITGIVTYFLCIDSLRAYRTKNGMSLLSSELEAYRNKNSSYPQSLEELTDRNPLKVSLTKDFWGNPILYTKENNTGFILRSFGKDGTANTSDDIVVKKP